jgi:tRNA A-37 threonylcarbamoyl transferase component Bud32
VLLATMNNRRVVVKRYNRKSAWHALRQVLRGTRAAASWCNAHALQFDGIRTARPHLLLEQRRGWFRGTAWVVMEYVAGPTARDLFADAAPLSGGQAAARDGIAMLLRALWELRISHGDMKATNIIVSGEGPVLLDLDALHSCRTAAGARRTRHRDLRRFLENWRDRPDLQQAFATSLGPDHP